MISIFSGLHGDQIPILKELTLMLELTQMKRHGKIWLSQYLPMDGIFVVNIQTVNTVGQFMVHYFLEDMLLDIFKMVLMKINGNMLIDLEKD
jgi:hypothetical protein